MPHSHPEGKAWAADIYAVVKPKVVVDIGPGAGMWWDALYPRFNSFFIGVEIWEPYITTYRLDSKYNQIIVQDAREFVDNHNPLLPNSGLFVLGDVLEHMPETDAVKMLLTLGMTNAHVLVSVPIHHYEQGELEGNPHEAHLWYPTHEWAMDVLKPEAYTKGDVVGTYWSAP